MSRRKQLITVFVVANAQKQEVMRARLVLASSTTMFQEERTRRTSKRFLAGGRPYPPKQKPYHFGYGGSGITLRAREKQQIVVFREAMSRVASRTSRVYRGDGRRHKSRRCIFALWRKNSHPLRGKGTQKRFVTFLLGAERRFGTAQSRKLGSKTKNRP